MKTIEITKRPDVVVGVRFDADEIARIDAARAVFRVGDIPIELARSSFIRLMTMTALPAPAPAPLRAVPAARCERSAHCTLPPRHAGACADVG